MSRVFKNKGFFDMYLSINRALLFTGILLAGISASAYADSKRIRVFSTFNPNDNIGCCGNGYELYKSLEMPYGTANKNVVLWAGWSDKPSGHHLKDIDIAVFLYATPEENGGLPDDSPFYDELKDFVQNGGLLITDFGGGIKAVNNAGILGSSASGNYIHEERGPVYLTHRAQRLAQFLQAPNGNYGSYPKRLDHLGKYSMQFENVAEDAVVFGMHAYAPCGSMGAWCTTTPAVVGRRLGRGYVLVIGTSWAEQFKNSSRQIRSFVARSLEFDGDDFVEIAPEPFEPVSIVFEEISYANEEIPLQIVGRLMGDNTSVSLSSIVVEDSRISLYLETKWTKDAGTDTIFNWSLDESIGPLTAQNYEVEAYVNGQYSVSYDLPVIEIPEMPKWPGIIAVTNDDGHAEDVYLMHPFGSSPVRITNVSGRGDDGVPSGEGGRVSDVIWSPNGRELAYMVEQWGNYSLRTIDSKGHKQKWITHDGSEYGLDWSPTGEEIVYVDGESNLIAINVNTLVKRDILLGEPGLRDPTWSPNGNYIAYRSTASGNSDIFTVDAYGGTNKNNVTDLLSNEYSPSWSPDGLMIAFTSNMARLDISETGAEWEDAIYIMDAEDGSNIVQVVTIPSTDCSLSWSPDGEKIAYSCDNFIGVVNTDGTGNTKIITNDDRGFSLGDWSPVSVDTISTSVVQSVGFKPRPVQNTGNLRAYIDGVSGSYNAILQISGHFSYGGARVTGRDHILAGKKIIFRLESEWAYGLGNFEVSPWSISRSVNGLNDGDYKVELLVNGQQWQEFNLNIPNGVIYPSNYQNGDNDLTGQSLDIRSLEYFPKTIDFGEIQLGRRSSATLLIENTGFSTLRILNIVTTNTDVVPSRRSFVLEPGDEVEVDIDIFPTDIGLLSDAVLRFATSDGDLPQVEVPLRASVVAEKGSGSLSLPVPLLDFGEVTIGQPRDLNLPIRNDGLSPLNIYNVVSDSRQIRLSPSALTIPAQSSRTVIARFVPLPGQALNGKLTLNSDDPNFPLTDLPWESSLVSDPYLSIVSSFPESNAGRVRQSTDIELVFSDPLFQRSSYVNLDVELFPHALSGPLMDTFELRGTGDTVIFPVELEKDTNYRLVVYGATADNGTSLYDPFELSFSTGRKIQESAEITGSIAIEDAEVDLFISGYVSLFDKDDALVAREPIGPGGGFEFSGVLDGTYRLYADIQKSDGGQMIVTYDEDEDGRADEISVRSGQNMTGLSLFYREAELLEPESFSEAYFSLDLNPDEGNQQLDEIEIEAGEPFGLVVHVEDAQSITNYSVSVVYDTTRLELVKVRAQSPIAKNNLLRISTGTPLFNIFGVSLDTVRIGGMLMSPSSDQSASGDGELAYYEFVGRDNVVGETEVRLVRVFQQSFTLSDTSDADVGVKVTVTPTASFEDTVVVDEITNDPVTIDMNQEEGDQEDRLYGGAVPGDQVELQFNVKDVPPITGWEINVSYDPEMVRYVSGSFRASSSFIPSLVPLVLEQDVENGEVGLGGVVLGVASEGRGDGTLGQATFEIEPGFQGETEIIVSYVSFKPVEGEQLRYVTRSVAVISEQSEVASLPGDFDGDGEVRFDDFFLFADGFGTTDAKYDLNSSGLVDFDDFFIFADNFGKKERAKLIAIAEELIGLPERTALDYNYPNPFNASTIIQYTVSERAEGLIGVYDLTGQLVKRLLTGMMQVGDYSLTWDGTDQSGSKVGSGVYIVRLSVGRINDSRKVMLVK